MNSTADQWPQSSIPFLASTMINVATNLVENEAKPVKSSLYCFWEYPLSPGTDPRGAWEQNYKRHVCYEKKNLVRRDSWDYHASC